MCLWYPYVNLFMKLWKCTFECLDIYNKIDGKLLNSDTSAVERSLIKTIILKKDRLEHYLLPMGWKLYSKPAYPHVENVRGFRFHQYLIWFQTCLLIFCIYIIVRALA